MNIIPTEIPDVKIIEPRVFSDARGFFFESYNQQQFTNITGKQPSFVQDNHSYSLKGVLRGLHYQVKRPQGKLVRVVTGAAFDVAVDLRRSSATFGRWVGVYLTADNKRMLWVPPGFAHGFLTLSAEANFLYKTTDFYDPTSEVTIRWDDPDLAIDWPKDITPLLSKKDSLGLLFKEASTFP